jgi:hypothetical protein
MPYLETKIEDMKPIALLIGILALLMACKQLNIAEGTPECIQKKIEAFKPETCEDGANVNEYKFQGKFVYTFDHGTCGADMTTEVTDSNCKTLGQLGGIIGNTMINGEDFGNAEFVRTIWKN